MSEELKFQKLAEVELLEKAPEGSHPIVEHEGRIKRVTGGLGGGGIPVFDLTPYVTVDNVTMDAEIIIVYPTLTEQETEDLIGLAAAGAILIHLDLGKVLNMTKGQNYVVNQVFSSQYFDGGSELPMRGVCFYSGLTDIMLLADDTSLLSMVGYMGNELGAQFVFPSLLVPILGA